MDLTHDDVLKILEVLDTADLEYFELRTGDTVIIANRKGAPEAGAVVPATETSPSTAPPSGAREPPSEQTTDQPPEAGLVEVSAPMVGVFYRSPEPGAPPFVDLGAEVEVGDTLGLVEVMKMFNGVTAPVSGSVAEILVETGAFVEFGQPLMQIRPSAAA